MASCRPHGQCRSQGECWRSHAPHFPKLWKRLYGLSGNSSRGLKPLEGYLTIQRSSAHRILARLFGGDVVRQPIPFLRGKGGPYPALLKEEKGDNRTTAPHSEALPVVGRRRDREAATNLPSTYPKL